MNVSQCCPGSLYYKYPISQANVYPEYGNIVNSNSDNNNNNTNCNISNGCETYNSIAKVMMGLPNMNNNNNNDYKPPIPYHLHHLHHHHHHHLATSRDMNAHNQPQQTSSYYSNYYGMNIAASGASEMETVTSTLSAVVSPPPPPPPMPVPPLPSTPPPILVPPVNMPLQHLNWYQSPPPIPAEYNLINMLHVKHSNGREARNRAEKNRRDKLNGSIQELSTMVPHVAESPRRVDKTAVLRFSAHGMRVDYVFGKSSESHQRINSPLTEAFLRLLNSFLITVTCKGQIVLVSPSIEQHLGHCQTDLFGQSIFNLTHADDHPYLKSQLIPTDLENLFDIQPDDETGKPRPRTQHEENEIDRKLREDRRNFTIRMARAGQRSDPPVYEAVRIDGCFRRADSAPRGVKASTFPSGLPLVRRVRGRDDSLPLHTISGNDIVLVAMGQVIKPPSICERLFEATKFEYKTRHLIDGRIVQCDQRISIVAGYMADEVSGLSPFTFMHKDDVRWVMVALRQMYDYGSSYGESCYRLMARTGQFIYLKTRGYLDIDKDTNQVRSFVCHNTLISEEEGRKLIREMKKKFAIMIQENDLTPMECDEPAVENPVQLERAILSLITNLHNTSEPEESVASPIGSYSSDDQHETESLRSTKSPPLALIAPKSETIKDSIRNSIKVIACATRGRTPDLNLTEQPNKMTPVNSCQTTDENQKRPSVVQKIENIQRSNIRNYRQHSPVPVSPSSTNTGCISSTQPMDSHQHTSPVYIKQEPFDSRVPPLPTSVRYFSDTNPYSSYRSASSSPSECASYNDQSPPPVIHPAQPHVHLHQHQYQPQHPMSSNFNLKGHSSGYGTPSMGRSTSVLKRTHSFETEENIIKRRLQNAQQQSPHSSSFIESNPNICNDQFCESGADCTGTRPSSNYPIIDNASMSLEEQRGSRSAKYQYLTDAVRPLEGLMESASGSIQQMDNKMIPIKQEYQQLAYLPNSDQFQSPISSTENTDLDYIEPR